MSDDAREALSSAVYERAFEKAMRGNDLDLTDEEREAARKAREATRTEGPGWPMPWRLDPSRSHADE